MEKDEIIRLLDSIEEKMINKENLGFSPEVLGTLDNYEASHDEIETLKVQIGNDILMRIFNFANSVYYGSLKKGSIYSFYEVVTRLGMSHVKALIIILALQRMARNEKEVEVIFARSFAASIMGNIFAHQCGLREDNIKKVELGALFYEMGKMVLLSYKNIYGSDDQRLDGDFIDKYHPYLTERIVEVFALPDYLKQIIFTESIVLEENYMTVSGVTQLALKFVEISFNKFHNHMVIEVTSPDILVHNEKISLDAIISEQFHAVGLTKYLRIIRKKERLLPEYESPKEQ